MSHSISITDHDMDLRSGIAAFEGKHFATAMQLLSPLAEEGDAEAQYRVAIMCQNGLHGAPQPADAYRWMAAAAEQGHPYAQHGLGFMYLEGECVEAADAALAATWFRRAADQGLIGSMSTLAMLYQEGRGVEQSDTEAAHWLKAAGF